MSCGLVFSGIQLGHVCLGPAGQEGAVDDSRCCTQGCRDVGLFVHGDDVEHRFDLCDRARDGRLVDTDEVGDQLLGDVVAKLEKHDLKCL